MLTINVDGKYEFYDYWRSYWYVGNARKRKFISKLIELEYYIYNEYKDFNECRKYFIQLVLSLFDKDLRSIIDEFILPNDMPNWKKRLITEKELLEDRFSDFFAITEDDSICYLLDSQRPISTEGSKTIC